ncbi:hypothetical protein D3C72_1789280 [compost metagenome]
MPALSAARNLEQGGTRVLGSVHTSTQIKQEERDTARLPGTIAIQVHQAREGLHGGVHGRQ